MIKRTFFILTVCFSVLSPCLAIPEGPFPDAVFNRNIKTVQFYKEGWEFSYPILEMDDEKSLLLSFDDLEATYKNFNYVIVHCDASWMPSRISFTDYMDGFYQNPLNNYQSSFSTHVAYNHYSLQIPNDNVKLKISGNYVLIVYENNNEDNPVFIKRFVIVEQKVTIAPSVRRPTLPAYQDEYQEVDFTIFHPEYPIENPYQSVNVAIVKNNQWKFSITDLKPLFIRNKELVYNYEDKNLFFGGNEYRWFDTKSLKYQSANIQAIQFVDNSWQVVLKPDRPRDRMSYFYNEDFNGKYSVQNQQGINAAVDAEYVNILFNFPMDAPLVDGDVYVFGGFTDFNCYDDNRMTYNIERKTYELDYQVKQGYFNYQYVYVKKNSYDVDERYFEGSFYETENDYVIYVYYRPFGSRYDHLIGVKVANSLNTKGL
jgi:hypothetical protein